MSSTIWNTTPSSAAKRRNGADGRRDQRAGLQLMEAAEGDRVLAVTARSRGDRVLAVTARSQGDRVLAVTARSQVRALGAGDVQELPPHHPARSCGGHDLADGGDHVGGLALLL